MVQTEPPSMVGLQMTLSRKSSAGTTVQLFLEGGLDLASDERFLQEWTMIVNRAISEKISIIHLNVAEAFIDGRGIRILESAYRYANSLGLSMLLVASPMARRAARFSRLLAAQLHQPSPN